MNGSTILEIEGVVVPTTCTKNAIIIIICAVKTGRICLYFHFGRSDGESEGKHIIIDRGRNNGLCAGEQQQ